VAQVACGFFHTMFLLQSSEVFAVGRGDWGLLGMGDRMDRKLPCKIVELQVLSLTAIMKRQTSNLAAAGPTYRFHRLRSPPQVTSLQMCAPILPNSASSSAVSFDGHLYMWGCGSNGRLGLGDVRDSSVPQ
jgi:alpha-tubulin suppressor-like RCC1 family protein